MRKLLILFTEWLMRKLNEAYHQECEWMDGEEKDEWFTQRREVYDAIKKLKEPHHD